MPRVPVHFKDPNPSPPSSLLGILGSRSICGRYVILATSDKDRVTCVTCKSILRPS